MQVVNNKFYNINQIKVINSCKNINLCYNLGIFYFGISNKLNVQREDVVGVNIYYNLWMTSMYNKIVNYVII